MKFYCITNNKNPHINHLLRTACLQHKIIYTPISSYQLKQKVSPPQEPCLMYRVEYSTEAILLESQMASNFTTTFYQSSSIHSYNFSKLNQLTIFSKENVPTLPWAQIKSNSRPHLKRILKSMPSFPLVLKDYGISSHGIGVIRIDSWESLISIIDFVYTHYSNRFIIQPYVKTKSSARLIVINNQVVDSIEYINPTNEFRSMVSPTPRVIPKNYSAAIQASAVKATQALKIDFGGVDILLSGKIHHVLEVNFPCNFSRAQLLTDVNIAGKMITYLLHKQKASSIQTSLQTPPNLFSQ